MKKYHMDITILNICRLPENSNLLQQLCISQFQLRPPPPPSPPGLISGISIFCVGWHIPRGGDS